MKKPTVIVATFAMLMLFASCGAVVADYAQHEGHAQEVIATAAISTEDFYAPIAFEDTLFYPTHFIIRSLECEDDYRAAAAKDLYSLYGIIKCSSELEITAYYFSYLDFVNAKQLEIVREYLGGELTDDIVVNYVMDNIVIDYFNFTALRHYDSIAFDDDITCPRRIIVRMYEASMAAHVEMRRLYAPDNAQDVCGIVPAFGRNIVDYR
jgi:hypothetical protein